MDQIGETMLSFDSFEQPVNSINVQFLPTPCEEELKAKFICTLCMKTFYNANALQNHKNTQHDGEVTDREWETGSRPAFQKAQANIATNNLCGFEFIPLIKNREADITTVHDGLTTRTYSEDTTYLIVTIEDDEIDSDAMKRSRLDRFGFGKRARMKPKQPIDLRGPFTCTFPSTMRPDLQCRQIFFNCCDYSLHYRQEHTKRRKAALRCQVQDGETLYYAAELATGPTTHQNSFVYSPQVVLADNVIAL
ncbi:unnamed protein product [Arctia plantaginis]|uniref:C2H2-type domain-containing protein n=1 Tax=Arctia plantaginis TaxID=874455 RepID=A0A8S1B8W9_ARCPL|nr:unnamed protein product [Arctia plantaginis]